MSMDMGALQKLMSKKGGDDEMDPMVKSKKMEALQALHDEMSKMMGGDLAGLKKVTVAAPDKAGLELGLDKAKDLMGKGVDLDDDSMKDELADADDASDDADHEHEAEDMDAHAAADPSAMDPSEDPMAEGLSADDAAPKPASDAHMSVADIQAQINALQMALKKKMLS